MKIINDLKNLLKRDNFLRPTENKPISGASIDDHNIKSTNLVGGTIGKEGKIYLGTKLYTMDGENARTVVNDGVDDRILIGKRPNGTYGIDVSSAGYNVFDAYEGEMDLTSKANDDWTEYDPNAFTYLSSTTVTVDTKYTTYTDFMVGDKVKLVQGGNTKYFYVTSNQEAELLTLKAGYAFTLTNDTITSIYFSRLANPYGHPVMFNFTSTLSSAGPDPGTITQGTGNCFFYMQGSICFVNYLLEEFQFTNAVATIDQNLPVAASDSFVGHYIGRFVSGTTPSVSHYTIAGMGMTLSRNDDANFATGTNLYHYGSIFYPTGLY